MKRSRKYIEASKKLEKRIYTVKEAMEALKDVAYTKFDGTVELSIKLGIDPKKSDQMVRGAVVLPAGTGKSKRVLVIASGEKIKEAEDSNADYVGGEEIVDKIAAGWLEFDAVIATPDVMKNVAKLGKILGPRGLMPNPKVGTVTFDVAKAIGDLKAGKVEFRTDKTGSLNVPVGKLSFAIDALVENCRTLMEAVTKAKPATAKGKYIKKIYASTTMSPSIELDISTLEIKAA
ncbi:MAG: 50S ribosomal protein L1 [Candidatus Fischerbacteria bacterium RBG_13_37_8]|uniref:Large ribosomal subunit protein uL1 n=1 Tax=Candidatus Fischerbacteria bacterium RBG_13_37_8 TaxID=1817863 RepID=A0A1F5V946_9BACT|nr:MAG: 50S ribosomal protein L1 [Candidatus Fischerbacteria bacterium RBG_13_37_8]